MTADTLLSDRGPAAFAVTTATLVLSFVFVAARLVCRIGLVRHFGWDDGSIVLAWLLALGLGVTIAVATEHGLGRHDGAIAPDGRGILHRCEYVFSILYNPALMATKTSILIFYLRLSQNTRILLRLGSFAVLAVVNVAGTVLTLINIFQCRPVAAGFTDNPSAQCIPLLTEFICSAPVNIVTDLAILALPLPVLTGMRLPSRQKTILVVTFALGIFVTIVDVVRIYYLQQAVGNGASSSASRGAGFGEGAEFAWNAAFAFMWSAVEVNVGIICACIPTLKLLIIRILPAMLVDPDANSSHGSSSKPAGHGHARMVSSTGPPPPPPPPVRAGHGPGKPAAGHRRNASNATTKTTYFGFVNMQRPKNMLDVSAGESFRYCTTVAVLFFLWGFSYGLLNTLNDAVAAVAHMTSTQTLGLTSAYFGGGYLFGPLLVGVWVLRHDEHHRREHAAVGRAAALAASAHLPHHHPDHHHHRYDQRYPHRGPSPAEDSVGGFKATFMVGLCFYGVGTIMFWPSAVLASFPGFLTSSFVVGFGLSILETAANPFLVLCGPPAYAEMRLLLAQGAQGVASVLSGLLAQNVFFTTRSAAAAATTILDVQWTYLAITLLCVALALFFYYMPLPEVRDADLARALATASGQAPPVDGAGRQEDNGEKGRQPWWTRPQWWSPPALRTVCLVLAVFAQWTYVAAQECMSLFFHPLIVSWLPSSPPTGPATAERLGRLARALASSSPSSLVVAMTTTGLAPDAATSDHPAGLVLSVPNALLVCRAAFAVSRFVAGGLVYLGVRWRRRASSSSSSSSCWWRPLRLPTTPRALLLWSTALTALCALLLVVLPPPPPGGHPNLLLVPVALFFFAEGPIWPLVFALGLRGQGTRTKRAAAYITMGASGPLFWPFVLYAVTSARAERPAAAPSAGRSQRRSSTQMAFIVVVALAAATMVYPLYLTLSRGGRQMSRVAAPAAAGEEEAKEGGDEEMGVPAASASRHAADGAGNVPEPGPPDNGPGDKGAATMPRLSNVDGQRSLDVELGE